MSKINDNSFISLGDISPLESPARQSISDVEKRELRNLKEFDKTAFNGLAEERFLEVVHELIRAEGGEVSRNLILRECAFELDVSTETIKRYLLKHTARKASLAETDGGKIRSKRHREVSR